MWLACPWSCGWHIPDQPKASACALRCFVGYHVNDFTLKYLNLFVCPHSIWEWELGYRFFTWLSTYIILHQINIYAPFPPTLPENSSYLELIYLGNLHCFPLHYTSISVKFIQISQIKCGWVVWGHLNHSNFWHPSAFYDFSATLP